MFHLNNIFYIFNFIFNINITNNLKIPKKKYNNLKLQRQTTSNH